MGRDCRKKMRRNGRDCLKKRRRNARDCLKKRFKKLLLWKLNVLIASKGLLNWPGSAGGVITLKSSTPSKLVNPWITKI